MNIFWLDEDPKRSAESYCDEHLNIIQKEIAQMLSTYLWEHVYDEGTVHERNTDVYDNIYNVFCPNNPIIIWLTEDADNIEEVLELANELHKEYVARNGRKHASVKITNSVSQYYHEVQERMDSDAHGYKKIFPDRDGGTEKPLCPEAKAEEYGIENPVWFHRVLYVEEKSDFATWSREKPEWYKTMCGWKGMAEGIDDDWYDMYMDTVEE